MDHADPSTANYNPPHTADCTSAMLNSGCIHPSRHAWPPIVFVFTLAFGRLLNANGANLRDIRSSKPVPWSSDMDVILHSIISPSSTQQHPMSSSISSHQVDTDRGNENLSVQRDYRSSNTNRDRQKVDPGAGRVRHAPRHTISPSVSLQPSTGLFTDSSGVTTAADGLTQKQYHDLHSTPTPVLSVSPRQSSEVPEGQATSRLQEQTSETPQVQRTSRLQEQTFETPQGQRNSRLQERTSGAPQDQRTADERMSHRGANLANALSSSGEIKDGNENFSSKTVSSLYPKAEEAETIAPSIVFTSRVEMTSTLSYSISSRVPTSEPGFRNDGNNRGHEPAAADRTIPRKQAARGQDSRGIIMDKDTSTVHSYVSRSEPIELNTANSDILPTLSPTPSNHHSVQPTMSDTLEQASEYSSLHAVTYSVYPSSSLTVGTPQREAFGHILHSPHGLQEAMPTPDIGSAFSSTVRHRVMQEKTPKVEEATAKAETVISMSETPHLATTYFHIDIPSSHSPEMNMDIEGMQSTFSFGDHMRVTQSKSVVTSESSMGKTFGTSVANTLPSNAAWPSISFGHPSLHTLLPTPTFTDETLRTDITKETTYVSLKATLNKEQQSSPLPDSTLQPSVTGDSIQYSSSVGMLPKVPLSLIPGGYSLSESLRPSDTSLSSSPIMSTFPEQKQNHLTSIGVTFPSRDVTTAYSSYPLLSSMPSQTSTLSQIEPSVLAADYPTTTQSVPEVSSAISTVLIPTATLLTTSTEAVVQTSMGQGTSPGPAVSSEGLPMSSAVTESQASPTLPSLEDTSPVSLTSKGFTATSPFTSMSPTSSNTVTVASFKVKKTFRVTVSKVTSEPVTSPGGLQIQLQTSTQGTGSGSVSSSREERPSSTFKTLTVAKVTPQPGGGTKKNGDGFITKPTKAWTVKVPTTPANSRPTTTEPMPISVTLTPVVEVTPTVYVTVVLRMSRTDFCPRMDEFKRVVMSILSQSVRDHYQMVAVPKDECSSDTNVARRSAEISIDVYVADAKGRYNLVMSTDFALVAEDSRPALDQRPGSFKGKFLRVKAIGLEGRSRSLLANQRDGDSALSVGMVAGIAVAGIVSTLIIAFIIFQMVLLGRRRGVKKMRAVHYDHSGRPSVDMHSLEESIQMISMGALMNGLAYHNPALDSDDHKDYTSNPLSFSELQELLRDPNSDDIEDEFLMLPNPMPKISEVPEGVEDKNRYANVIPIQETRVPLAPTPGGDHCDYINANYVRGYGGKSRMYIATQAPMENTRVDFWEMVWQQQSQAILMLTDLDENGQSKCVEYWPNTEGSDIVRIYGDYHVQLQRRDVTSYWIRSALLLKNMETNLCREVHHLWLTAWPPSGVPHDPGVVLAFLEEATPYMQRSHGPPVVHCSPGTGRTGTLLAIDMGRRAWELTGRVDVLQCVRQLREDRAGAIQTKDQYAFVYQTLLEYALRLTDPSVSSMTSSITGEPT